MGHEAEANASFIQAIQLFRQFGLLIDYARALQRYGYSLLLRNSATSKSKQTVHNQLYQQALSYLREARDIFETSKARLDLEWVEHLLAHPVHP